jgi:protein CpxP
MSPFAFPTAMSTRVTRSVAVAALLGVTMLAGPLSAAPATTAPFQLAQSTASQSPPAADTAATKAETVEQRITNLHTALQITPNEEANWAGVAQAMRGNAATMEKLAADKADQASQGMTAMDDLKVYEKFARAHVAGLKTLSASFDKLYTAMPAAQKKVADAVFQNFGHHEGTASHS